MSDYKHLFPVLKMSGVFGVSASGYYRWRSRGQSLRSQANTELGRAITRIWKTSYERYGAPNIHVKLRQEGKQVSLPRVARLMRSLGVASRLRRKWVKTTDSSHRFPVAPNVLERHFYPERLNQVWVSDITFLPTPQGWIYLTTVMDLADRQIIGWSLSSTMSAQHTSIKAFQQAQARRGGGRGLVFHSDQGSQYACGDFVRLLQSHGFTQSMSRKGNCWDNAPAESFFKTLKAELSNEMASFKNYAHARAVIFDYIEIWYNRKRLHSTLGYRTPCQAEQQLKQTQAA